MADSTRRVSVRLSLDDAARVKAELRDVGWIVGAGFEFDVPVRFDTDALVRANETWRAAAVRDIDFIDIRI